jgi:hypothetical protein
MGNIKLQYKDKLWEIQDYCTERSTNGSREHTKYSAKYKGQKVTAFSLIRLISKLERLIDDDLNLTGGK